MKICSKCHQSKPLKEFGKTHSHRNKICKTCVCQYFNEYRRRTRFDTSKAYFWNARAVTMNKMVREEHGITTIIHSYELQEKFKEQHNCWLCGIDLSPVDAHFDHVIPLSRGGEHTISNIEMLCPPCNRLKKASLISELIPYITRILKTSSARVQL